MAERVRLVVLFGGQSAEHEVSCVSARHVLAAADPNKYDLEPIGITKDGRWVRATEALNVLQGGRELPESLTADGPVIDPIPVIANKPTDGGTAQVVNGGDADASMTVVLPVLHGPNGEDGTAQGLLELAGVPYAGAGVLASAMCMDKSMANTLLAAAGIPHAQWRTASIDDPGGVEDGDDCHLDDIIRAEAQTSIDDIGLPMFVKPANMGSSVGISKAHDLSEVVDAIRLAARYDQTVLFEQAANGREIEVAVLGNDKPQASVPGEIIPGAEFYDYDDKYKGGAELIIPAELDDDEIAAAQEMAIRAFQALRVEGLARVDFFYEDGRNGRGDRGWMVNELNTMPGFTPISMYPRLWQASGLAYPDLIDHLVELALERHARRRRHSHTDH